MGPCQYVADQLLTEADVIRTMHEPLQLFQDPHTEFALLRESLGVRGINQKATLNASHLGIGYRRARDDARPAHLEALIAAKNAES